MKIVDERPGPKIKELMYLKPGTPFGLGHHVYIVTDLGDNGTPDNFKMLVICLDDGHGLYLDPDMNVALVNAETRVKL